MFKQLSNRVSAKTIEETYTENDLVSVFRFNEARKKDHKTKMRDLGDGSRTTKTYVSMRENSSIHADMGD